MAKENLSLDKSSQSAFSKAVRTIKKNLKNSEVDGSDAQGSVVKAGGKGNKSKKSVPKPTDRGVVYLRHIPHGFYEEPMKAYFSQFGQVTGIKLIRSQKTGQSRGFAFVEFLHTEVAKVVAETMNNYLMFDRLIKAEYVPPEKQTRVAFRRGLNTQVITPATCLRAKNRAKFIRHKNKSSVDTVQDLKERQAMVKKLAKLTETLGKQGIEFHFEPVDAPAAPAESCSEDDGSAPVLELDESDSEFEFNAPPGTIIKPLRRDAIKKKVKRSHSGAMAPPTKDVKGVPTPAKQARTPPSAKKINLCVPMPVTEATLTAAEKVKMKKQRAKTAHAQVATDLFNKRMEKARFALGLNAKKKPATGRGNPKANRVEVLKAKAKAGRVKVKAVEVNAKAKANGQRNGEATATVSSAKLSAGVQLNRKMAQDVPKVVAPKAIAKKVLLKHQKVKLTPRKTPMK